MLRTALLKDGKAYVQAGGGWVNDSTPDNEFQETVNKAKAMLKAVALAESCFNPDKLFGAEITLPLRGRADQVLFGESQSRIVISVSEATLETARARLTNASVPFLELGRVGEGELRIAVDNESYRWPIDEIHDLWFNSIARAVGGDSSERIPSL